MGMIIGNFFNKSSVLGSGKKSKILIKLTCAMVINYFGNGAFKLQNGETTLLVDPDNNRLKADVVLRTLTPTSFSTSGGAEAPQNEFSFPGEFEIKGIEISGVGVPEESTEKFLKTVYLATWDEIKIAFLGHISKPLSAETLDKLDDPDVLILPVGGGHFLAPEAAAKLVKQIEPSVIIPSFCKNPSDFLRALGKKAENAEKLVFKKKDLTGEGRIIVLSHP